MPGRIRARQQREHNPLDESQSAGISILPFTAMPMIAVGYSWVHNERR